MDSWWVFFLRRYCEFAAPEESKEGMMLLWSVGCLISVHLSLSIISTVIGSRVRGVAAALSFFIPFRTISSLGVSCAANWLCKPAVMCKLWTADKYTLIVWWVKLCWARWLTNMSSVSSAAGIGVLCASPQKVRIHIKVGTCYKCTQACMYYFESGALTEINYWVCT